MAISERQTGFSLIELVMVIVILALASLAIGTQFMQSAQSWMLDERIQTASQLAQARAEQLLADRRLNNYSAVPAGTTSETLAGNYTGYTRTTVVSAYAGAACPVADCRQVVITVTDADAQVRAETTLMVANY
ncbi:type II secretion system protein [Thiohalobacter thiocyanaticus]|uniref:type II secretion system protein n=1 Tax=Thiohalobacter thiocyanaticus TaxID=585455 RepID=UPI0015611E95|nr:type II secretion system protein [Thiohalobacter thiocyanaticus]